ncbi:MAG TPA: hypothetical protein VFG91_10545 [Woeseiaceae bacterium]|nr:hypothetical protein [Woeseiaceae bacterium]
MTYEWHDLLGNIGVLLILGTYLLLQMQRLSAQGWLYSAANGLGALLVLLSLTQQFNLSAFAMELVWLFISIYGLKQWYRRRIVRDPGL